MVNAENLGLSHCRNLALASCSTRYILFIDDDVRITGGILSAIRQGFQAGHHIVGTRLRLPASVRMPWYITEGQLHYLGIRSGCRNAGPDRQHTGPSLITPLRPDNTAPEREVVPTSGSTEPLDASPCH